MNIIQNFIKIRNVRKGITIIYPFLFPIINFLANISARFTSFLYFILMKMDWNKLPPTEWMDHDQDTFYQFNSKGLFFHFERGILPRLYASSFLFKSEEFKNLNFQRKINILDLCSGDSYISQKFFFDVSENVVSLDLDLAALNRGKKRIKNYKYLNPNHYFYKFDVEKNKIKDFLNQKKLNIKFDIVLFNAAIEHFKEDQLDYIFLSLKEVMKEKSFMSCYTIVEDKNEQKYLPDHHEMFFSNKEHLQSIVSKYFKYTKSYHSFFKSRCNIYCIGSEQKIEI
jgi:cyclopropane fatty-acyl-phospholipid synthase-like methyltransferase